jgi:subtilisin family serine protease
MVQAGVVVVAAAGNDSHDLAGPDGIYQTAGFVDDALPAALAEAMAVSAMDPTTDQFAAFSNYSQIPRPAADTNYWGRYGGVTFPVSPGGAIDVVAPGVNILSTSTDLGTPRNYGYALYSGTSFAAPHVAGLVALYIAANGRATNAQGVMNIRQAIINNSLPQSQWRTNSTLDPDTNPEPLAMPSENWVPQPFITGTSNVAGGFQLHFSTVPGYDYTVQSASSLSLSNQWTNVATVAGSSNVAPVSVTDTNLSNQTFYRLARQPAP